MEPSGVTVRLSLLLSLRPAWPLVAVVAPLTVKSAARASNPAVNICAASSRAGAQSGMAWIGLVIGGYPRHLASLHNNGVMADAQ